MRSRFLLIVALSLICLSGQAQAQTTITFQQGIGGYNGLSEVYIALNDADSNVVGADVESQFMDGRYNTGSDIQGLFRFSNILNQVPSNATILDATLTFATSEVSNAASGGPYGVSRLTTGFDNTTTYNSAGAGFRFADGEAARPIANGFVGMENPGEIATANVTRIVQDWANGAANNGFVVTAGTTNGWSVFTSGAPDATIGPQLSITYADDPAPVTNSAIFRQSSTDANNRMFLIDVINDTFTNGDTLRTDGEFLDGGGDEAQAFLQFDEIFEAVGGVVPDDAEIENAYLRINTATSDRSANSGTAGEYGLRQILNEWDENSSVADVNLGAFIDAEGGLIADAVAEFDVTALVTAWQNGESNFGVAIGSTGTTDGWGILFSSSDFGPELVVNYRSSVPEPASAVVVAGIGLMGLVRRKRS